MYKFLSAILEYINNSGEDKFKVICLTKDIYYITLVQEIIIYYISLDLLINEQNDRFSEKSFCRDYSSQTDDICKCK